MNTNVGEGHVGFGVRVHEDERRLSCLAGIGLQSDIFCRGRGIRFYHALGSCERMRRSTVARAAS